MSVTSRILVVDMLQGDIPTELITGLLVLHAEKCAVVKNAHILTVLNGEYVLQGNAIGFGSVHSQTIPRKEQRRLCESVH